MQLETTLIQQVLAIQSKYQLVNELNASRFNIFKILNVHSNERYTHSAFLAELLNKDGSHGQGTLFQDLWLSSISPEAPRSLWFVKTEQYTGSDERGYLDIILESQERILIIENKIYAGDQPAQLKRYENYALKRGKNYQLFYLTIEGALASEDSTKDLFKNYSRISYRYHIKKWLEQCVKEVARKAVLRETIYQYIQIINLLCGIPLNHEEAMELNDLLKKDVSHFVAANNIHELFKTVKYQVKFEFWEKIFKKLESYFQTQNNNSKWSIWWHFDEGETYPAINIALSEFSPTIICYRIERLQDMPYYGLCSYNLHKYPDEQKELINNYKTKFDLEGFRSTPSWFGWKEMHPNNFSQIDTLKKLFDPTQEQQLLNEITDQIITFVELHEPTIYEVNKELALVIPDRKF